MSERIHAAARPQHAAARPVSKPHDRHEREAERAAAEVARGGSVAGWSFSAVRASAPPVQRQGAGGQGGQPEKKSDDDKLKEGLLKAGEAALQTKAGKDLTDKVLADPGVKKLTDFATSPAGIAVESTLAAGGVTALAAAHKPLPIQPPAVEVSPGVSVQVSVQGPLNRPTGGMVVISFSPPGPKKKGPSAEQYRAETARMELENQALFGHMTYTAGSKEAEEQRMLQEAIDKVAADHGLRGFAIPLTPPAKQDEQPRQAQQQPVQRAPATAAAASPDLAHVDDALAGGGRPLDPATRRTMEARFGRDFAEVRIHDDARAAETAASIDASAFTVGQDVAFGPGRYAPRTAAGRELLAHELAHVVQQRGPRLRGVVVDPERGEASVGEAAPGVLLGQADTDAAEPPPEEDRTAAAPPVAAAAASASPAPSAPCRITSKTDVHAPDGTPDTRTTLAMGEVVHLSVGGPAADWAATGGFPRKGTRSTTFDWELSEPGAATVTATVPSTGATCSIGFTAVGPTGLRMGRASVDPVPAGTVGAGMRLIPHFEPLNVSFSNCEWLEVPGPATGVSGYFSGVARRGMDLSHHPNAAFVRIGPRVRDHAFAIGLTGPFSAGRFHWTIPNRLRRAATTGPGRVFFNSVQRFRISAAGRVTVSKQGASVTRDP